ncbi:major facilitator superfamily domain-containing protein [Mortierella sp. GBAus27b]|nr:major facilitator superfamily domain-containing protein [Mortierella sp. GBAus27b]
MASKHEYTEDIHEQDAIPLEGKIEAPVQDKIQDGDDLSTIASEVPAPPAQLFHKPPPRQFVLIMIALSLCVFLASLDQIIVSTSIPAITTEFNSLNDISWLATAYMVTATAFQPLYGKFSDIFGRKSMMLFANFMFLVGSAIAGWATSMVMLIVGRGVAGMGAGGLMAMVFIILSDMLDMRERGKYMGFIGAIFSFSSVIGPLMGGAFTDHLSWRWSFWINLPFGGISMLFIMVNLNLPTPKGSLSDKLKRIDYLGAILLMCSVILLLLPLSWGGSTYAWNSGIVIGLLVAGFVVAVIFILVEWKVPKEPLLPIHLFRIRNLWSTYGSLFFSGMSFFGILFYLPVYFQVVKKESATVGGLETVPFVFGIVITSISSGIWVLKKGTFAFFPALGNLFFITGAALCILFTRDSPRVATVFILLICGFGMGFTFQASTLAVQAAVKPKYMATVTTTVQFVRALGQVFGVAIVGSVFNNKLQGSLEQKFPNDRNILLVTQNYGHIYSYQPADVIRIYDSFILGLHYVFYCSVAFCSLALIMSFFIQHYELKTNSNQGAGGERPKPELAVEMV